MPMVSPGFKRGGRMGFLFESSIVFQGVRCQEKTAFGCREPVSWQVLYLFNWFD